MLPVNVKALFLIFTDSYGTASFEVCWMPLTLLGLQISSSNGFDGGGATRGLINLVQLCFSQCNYLPIRLTQLGLSHIYNTNRIPLRRPLCHVTITQLYQ